MMRASPARNPRLRERYAARLQHHRHRFEALRDEMRRDLEIIAEPSNGFDKRGERSRAGGVLSDCAHVLASMDVLIVSLGVDRENLDDVLDFVNLWGADEYRRRIAAGEPLQDEG